jgi:hypothetical protein
MQASSRSIRQEANDHTRLLYEQNGGTAGEFLCECDDAHCHAFVWLTLRELDTLRAAGEPVFEHSAEVVAPPALHPT